MATTLDDVSLPETLLNLVMDFDSTLFHTTQDITIAKRMGYGTSRTPDIHRIQLFDTTTGRIHYHYIKLRPGLHEFLARCAMKYKLFVNTHGTTEYAQAVLKLIDPHGTYFGQRVKARTTGTVPDLKELKQTTDQEELTTLNTLIVDDRLDVWIESNLESIIHIEPYVYFKNDNIPSSSTTTTTPTSSSSSSSSSSSAAAVASATNTVQLPEASKETIAFDNELSCVDMDTSLLGAGDVLMKIEILFREYFELKKAKIDVLHFVRHFRTNILTNVSICFDNLGVSTEYWRQYATLFGANVRHDVQRGNTTHLITTSLLSEKSKLALRSDCKVVTLQWLIKSMALFKREKETNYPVLKSSNGNEGVEEPEIEPLSTRYKD